MNIKVTGLHHIGIPTSDVQKSIAFYEGLGFHRVLEKYNFEGSHLIYLENNGCRIGIPESLAEGKNDAGKRPSRGAVDHFALQCADVEDAYAQFKDAGYTFVTNGIQDLSAWAPQKCRFFIIVGPDNVQIEFVEMS